MIGALAQLFAGIGVPARMTRLLAIGALVVLAFVALWIALSIHDRRVVAEHEAAAAAEATTADRAADAQAATRRRTDDARLEAEADALEEVTENEMDAADPLAARRAYYDCVRVQQQARAAGRLSPACR
jgi:hypothetical protein